jgi:integrase
MTSLQRDKRTKNWQCSYYDPLVGKWRLRSTGTSDKVQAQEICAKMESLTLYAHQNGNHTVPVEEAGEIIEAFKTLSQKALRAKLTEPLGREFLNKLLEKSALEPIKGETVQAYFRSWLAGKALSKEERTAERYKTVIKLFLEGLGKRAEMPLAAITPKDIEKFRNQRLDSTSFSTTKQDLKIIRSVFNVARKQGIILTNPAEAIELPKGEGKTKAPFTESEIRLLLTEIQSQKSKWNPEWLTLLYLGYFTGMRLGDAAALTWDSIDFTKNTITYTPSKTKKPIVLPMHPDLESHLSNIANDTSNKFLSPKLSTRTQSGRSGLSSEFIKIIKAAGIDSVESEQKSGRKFSAKTFHSLRHTFTSVLANQGISPEIRMKLTGHSSKNVHQGYTHLEHQLLKTTISKLPSFSKKQ